MKQEEALLAVLDLLEKEKIPYFLTGSFATNLHGAPRATHDADIVIQGSSDKILQFVSKLPQDFYATDVAVREAFASKSLFNLIHVQEGFKFDLIPLQETPFDRSRFERRIIVDWRGRKIFFSTAEDIILIKLCWARDYESERQLRDAQGVVEIQRESLDWEYLNHWAKELGVEEILQKITS